MCGVSSGMVLISLHANCTPPEFHFHSACIYRLYPQIFYTDHLRKQGSQIDAAWGLNSNSAVM